MWWIELYLFYLAIGATIAIGSWFREKSWSDKPSFAEIVLIIFLWPFLLGMGFGSKG